MQYLFWDVSGASGQGLTKDGYLIARTAGHRHHRGFLQT